MLVNRQQRRHLRSRGLIDDIWNGIVAKIAAQNARLSNGPAMCDAGPNSEIQPRRTSAHFQDEQHGSFGGD